jgi:hypothetical protein
MTLIYVVFAIIVLLWLWNKNLKRKMNSLVSTAKIAVCLSYITHIQNVKTNQILGDEEVNKIASAVTNFLFGHKVNPIHKDMDFKKINNEAIFWFEKDTLLQELVVQSLRVMTRIQSIKNSPLIQNEYILSTYGKQFPVAPNPDSYMQLVRSFVDTLNDKDKQALKNMA